MVARQAVDRMLEAAEDVAHVRVAGRVVLHEVAGQQRRIPGGWVANACATAALSEGSVGVPRSCPAGSPNRWQSVNWTRRMDWFMPVSIANPAGPAPSARPRALQVCWSASTVRRVPGSDVM